MSVTLATLRQELGVVAGGCKIGTLTSIGNAGGTTMIDTTNFADSYMNASYYNGRYAILTSGTYSGQIRRVSSYAGASGTITVADAYGGQVASGVTFELHAIDPTELKNAINRVLARMYYWTFAYPSLAADGDMETSGTTDWTVSSSAVAKETSVVKYGTQSLKVTNSGANGYARTASIPCTPTDMYHVTAVVRADNFTASIVAYDVTNSAAITLTTTPSTSGREWKRLWTSFQIPSGCEQFQIRLTGADAAAIIYWDNLLVQQVNKTRILLPSWITEAGNVVEVQSHYRTRTDPENSGVDFIDEESWSPLLPRPRVEQDRTAVNPFYLQFDDTIGYQGYRALCVRPFTSLSADSSTTMAPMEWVVAGGILELLRTGILRAPGNQEAEFKSQINAWKKDWMRLCRVYQPHVEQRMRSPWDA